MLRTYFNVLFRVNLPDNAYFGLWFFGSFGLASKNEPNFFEQTRVRALILRVSFEFEQISSNYFRANFEPSQFRAIKNSSRAEQNSSKQWLVPPSTANVGNYQMKVTRPLGSFYQSYTFHV